MASDNIEQRARERFYQMHGVPLNDIWDTQDAATKESYRQWALDQVRNSPDPCRVFEYDGALKCVTHQRQWGALPERSITGPCPQYAASAEAPHDK